MAAAGACRIGNGSARFHCGRPWRTGAVLLGSGSAPLISTAVLNETGAATGVSAYAAACALSLPATVLVFRTAPVSSRG